MKQYTNTEQTSKLIELGFNRPKSISSIKVTGDIITTADDLIGEPSSVIGGKYIANYSIGELIEMLPITIRDGWYQLEIKVYLGKWKVSYIDITNYSPIYYILEDDLIDAIFNMIIKLKKEKVL